MSELEKMETSGGYSPTPSQEDKLLNQPNTTKEVGNNLNMPNEVESHRTAKLSDIRKICDANKASGEITISLQTGSVITKNRNKNRNRSSHKRSIAKNAGVSNDNPHERNRVDLTTVSSPNKRHRVTGETPPNLAQQAKKQFIGKHTEPPAPNVSQQSGGNRTSGIPPIVVVNEGRSTGPARARPSRNERRRRANMQKQQITEQRMKSEGQSQNEHQGGLLQSNTDSPNVQQTVPSGSKMHSHTGNDDDVAATFAAAAKGHTMAIIDQRQPGQMQMLTQDRVDKINSLLTDAIIALAGTDSVPPVFENARLHSGAMRVQCGNAETRLWLERNVPKIDSRKLWQGAKLVVIQFNDIPKPHKFNVVFRNVNKSPKDLFKLLEVQNGISTMSWTVISNVKKDNGTAMTIGVGQDSFEMLRARSNTLHCGMGKATFILVKGCKENQAMLQQGVGNNQTDTIDVDALTEGEPQEQGDSGKTVTEEMEVALEGDTTTNVGGQS